MGRGGSATVYLAQDLRHGRRVALKVLHSALGAALGVERFQREIRTQARLQHPHILPLFDSGIAAGRLFYAMPYVEAGSLRDRLRQVGRLETGAAVQLALEVASALAYAHSLGIIHRDLKPENIMLSPTGEADPGRLRDRLRPGGAGGVGRGTTPHVGPSAHRDRHHGGHADVHEPGAGGGRRGADRAERPVLAGGGGVRGTGGQSRRSPGPTPGPSWRGSSPPRRPACEKRGPTCRRRSSGS